MAYLLDANVFIQAKNLHYGFDFCPAFWDWLVVGNGNGRIFSIEKVGDEVMAGTDALATWAAGRGSAFFVAPDAASLASLRAVSAWVMGADFDAAAKNTFLQVADYYLVAQAHATGFTVVTHEIVTDSRKRIKIPNVCAGVGVKCVSPYEMLRAERARFVLGPHASGGV